jgi:AhpD family alkylhydroperoxidase
MSTVDPAGFRNEAEGLLAELERQYQTLPKAFAYMACNPEALRAFSEFLRAVMGGGSLPRKYKELAYLKAAMDVKCALCTGNHRRSARRAGYSEDQLDALEDYGSSALFTEEEKIILRYADQFSREPGLGSPNLLDELKGFLSDGQIVELTMVLGLANYFGRFNNALRTHVPE